MHVQRGYPCDRVLKTEHDGKRRTGWSCFHRPDAGTMISSVVASGGGCSGRCSLTENATLFSFGEYRKWAAEARRRQIEWKLHKGVEISFAATNGNLSSLIFLAGICGDLWERKFVKLGNGKTEMTKAVFPWCLVPVVTRDSCYSNSEFLTLICPKGRDIHEWKGNDRTEGQYLEVPWRNRWEIVKRKKEWK